MCLSLPLMSGAQWLRRDPNSLGSNSCFLGNGDWEVRDRFEWCASKELTTPGLFPLTQQSFKRGD